MLQEQNAGDEGLSSSSDFAGSPSHGRRSRICASPQLEEEERLIGLTMTFLPKCGVLGLSRPWVRGGGGGGGGGVGLHFARRRRTFQLSSVRALKQPAKVVMNAVVAALDVRLRLALLHRTSDGNLR